MNTWSDMENRQPLASKILINSFKKDRLSHAYLFRGSRGTGKRQLALLLVKTLFCPYKQSIEPCHECRVCKRIASGNHPDVHWLSPDGQSIKLEQIKYLQREFTYSGLESAKKVYVIEHADTLTLNAANRLLKFLEEPREHTTAIMLTENSQSIIPTIRSRCQFIDLKPLKPSHFQHQLISQGLSEEDARLMSALTTNMEDAIHLQEDKWFAQARKIMLQLIHTYMKNPADIFLFVHKHWIPHFKERDQQERGLDLLLLAFKDILYVHIGYKESLVVFHPEDPILERALLTFSQEKLFEILNALLQAKRKLKQNVHPTLVMEQLTLHI